MSVVAPYQINTFPSIWIVSRLPYSIKSSQMPIIQTENVAELIKSHKDHA